MKKAVYAGSFDPITNGHLWVIEQGLLLFDKVVVAVGSNPEKSHTFSVDERVEMLKAVLKNYPRTEAAFLGDRILVRYAKSINADFMLRGIRSQRDYDYESGVWEINYSIEPTILAVFLKPPAKVAKISSSMVKELAHYKEWGELRKYVPEAVYKKLRTS